MSDIYGLVVEKHSGRYDVSPAVCKEDSVTCHDPCGFLGSKLMNPDGVFFQSISGESLCQETLEKAQQYARVLNKSLQMR